jgi:mannose-6-phosphate isomerase-like protein (cupin superfamily)
MDGLTTGMSSSLSRMPHRGNADDERAEHGGWFVGHFMSDGDIAHSSDVEVKWGVHNAGDAREVWQHDETRTTVVFLVRGRFHVELSTESHVLVRPGDYSIWGAGVSHSWWAEEDSIVLTIRWPSLP